MDTRALRSFLKTLEEKFPPDAGCHHSFTTASFWLILSIVQDHKFWPIFVDDGDLEKPIDQVLSEIEQILIQSKAQSLAEGLVSHV